MFCNFHELNHFYGCVSFTQRNMTNFSDRYLGAPQFKWKIPLNFMDNCLKVTRCYARTDQGKILLTPMHLFRVLCAFLVVAQPDGVSFRLTRFVSTFFALIWNQCKPALRTVWWAWIWFGEKNDKTLIIKVNSLAPTLMTAHHRHLHCT